MAFTNYFRDFLINHVMRGEGTLPATLYFSVWNVAPDFQTGAGGTECSGTGYSRIAVTVNVTNFTQATGGSGRSNNATVIEFTASAGGSDWGNLVAGGVHDAVTAGNLLWGNNLTTSKTVNSGDPVNIPIGDFYAEIPSA